MKKTILFFLTITLLYACKETPKTVENKVETAVEAAKTIVTPAVLSDEEKAAGFKLLFNGVNTEGWHPYKNTKDSTYKWTINDGVLATNGGHVDLVSDSSYENFELRFDWKVGKAGNSGVMYMVQENTPNTESTWHTGVEFQVIDHEGWPDKLHESQKAGAAYDLYDPLVLATNKAGEWNSSVISIHKNHVEHYINGKKTADYEWNSKDFKERVAKSKFKAMPFGKVLKGQFALQDHGQAVAYRNIRIKTL